MQEQEITALLAERREEGMDALLRHYGPLMRYVISGILQDPRDREECLSEAAMQVWEHIGQFSRQRGSWNVWLTAVARNTALNHARKNARHAGAEELTEHTAAGPSPEEEVVRREREQELLEALGRLLPEDLDYQALTGLRLEARQRLLFYRKYYYLQTTARIAAELGMTERAVEGKLYRLKRRLRKMLGGDQNG